MACESVKVSVYYDMQGKQIGRFKFECKGPCDDTKLECKPVEYVDVASGQTVFYCQCVVVQDGKYDHVTATEPPGSGSPCEGHIILVEKKIPGGREFEAQCPGSCDKPKRCKKLEEEKWETIWGEDGSARRIMVKTFWCKCKKKDE